MIHEHIVIAATLSIFGGYLDAYTYMLKGGVFANAQTGNLVLLFISMIQRDFSHMMQYLIPIIMFALGIFLADRFKRSYQEDHQNSRIKLVIFFEAIMLLVIAAIGGMISNHMVNSIISFVAAVQVVNFDKINGNPVATTMITGNLRSSMVNLNNYIATKESRYRDNFISYFVIIISFGCGVMIGSICCSQLGEHAILVAPLFLMLAYLILRVKERYYRLNIGGIS